MTHIMVDLETMGTAVGAAVASVGAVVFDPFSTVEDPVLGAEFYCTLNLAEQQAWGLTLDASTVYWWLQQSEEARQALFTHQRSAGPGLGPSEGAQGPGLAAWVAQQVANTTPYSQPRAMFWCHGATFDAPILEKVYRTFLMDPWWHFADVRDTRTVYDMAGVSPDRSKGTHHNALDDAKAQALAVMRAYRKLGVRPEAL